MAENDMQEGGRAVCMAFFILKSFFRGKHIMMC